MNNTKFRIYGRRIVEINTDPQRRCYNGCHFSSEKIWTEWAHLGTVYSKEEAEQSVNSWGMIVDKKDRQYKYVEVPIDLKAWEELPQS